MTAVAIAPDGSWLASGHEDGSVRIWDRATGQERAVLTGQAEAVTAVAIAPDGVPGRGEQLPGGLQLGSEFGLGEAVVDGAALGPAGDQAGFLQLDQVGGDVGLGAAELGGQVGDALFAGLQGEQDGQPGGVGQDAEQGGRLPGVVGVGSQADRHAVTVAAAAAGGAGDVRGVRGGEGLGAGPGQGGQQRGAAGGGGLVEPGADVAFEPAELVAQRGWADAQGGGRSGDGGVGHGDLEPAQPLPACRAVLGRAADVAGDLASGLGRAAGAGLRPGDVPLVQSARVGRGGTAGADHGDAVLTGDLARKLVLGRGSGSGDRRRRPGAGRRHGRGTSCAPAARRPRPADRSTPACWPPSPPRWRTWTSTRPVSC